MYCAKLTTYQRRGQIERGKKKQKMRSHLWKKNKQIQKK